MAQNNYGYGANGGLTRPTTSADWGGINVPPEVDGRSIRRPAIFALGSRVIPAISVPEKFISVVVDKS